MKNIVADLDVFTVVKLEQRAAKEGLTLEQYVSLFLAKEVEPIM